MNNETRKCTTSSGSSPLMKTDTTKGLLQIIVGAREVGNLITEKQVRSITLSDLKEMGNGLGEGPTELSGMLLHMQQHDLELQFSL
jgi:hypothetical protein